MKGNKMVPSYQFVIDFDGTISINDSTTRLAEIYIPERHQTYLKAIRSGKISVKTYIKEQLEAIEITKEEYIAALSREMRIDPTFKNFLAQNWAYAIVSAGTLQNVYYSLKEKGIQIPKEQIISNQLSFDHKKLQVEMPQAYEDAVNGVDKAKIIQAYQKQGYQVVFIGDSLSDFAGAKAADIVYAKKDQKLAAYLQDQAIPFIEYQDFDEIINHFQSFLANNK